MPVIVLVIMSVRCFHGLDQVAVFVQDAPVGSTLRRGAAHECEWVGQHAVHAAQHFRIGVNARNNLQRHGGTQLAQARCISNNTITCPASYLFDEINVGASLQQVTLVDQHHVRTLYLLQ